MSKECVEQVEGAGASVPMTDISNIDVPEGTDELSRSTRRAWRERLNSASTRKMITGVLATLVGGSFWGFSGTSASFLFDTYHVDTLWLMSVRQILAGLLFMAVVVTRDRERLIKLWTTPADRKQLLHFTAFGLLFNQFCYLSAVRLTNAGTATVLQCLQLVIIMGYVCVTDRRMPRTREVIGTETPAPSTCSTRSLLIPFPRSSLETIRLTLPRRRHQLEACPLIGRTIPQASFHSSIPQWPCIMRQPNRGSRLF